MHMMCADLVKTNTLAFKLALVAGFTKKISQTIIEPRNIKQAFKCALFDK